MTVDDGNEKTGSDKSGSKVHLGAVDRSWIAGAILTLACGAVTWGVKIDNRQSVHEAHQEGFSKRQDDMVVVLQRLTDLAEVTKTTTDQQLPRIDQRLAEIERRLDRLDAQDDEARQQAHRPKGNQDG